MNEEKTQNPHPQCSFYLMAARSNYANIHTNYLSPSTVRRLVNYTIKSASLVRIRTSH